MNEERTIRNSTVDFLIFTKQSSEEGISVRVEIFNDMINMMKKSKDMKKLRYNNICLRALALLCLMMASVGA